MRTELQPRPARFFGVKTKPQYFNLRTWLEPEEITYPSGNMIRRARALNVDTGRLNLVHCGVPVCSEYTTQPKGVQQ
jgi:hypothetical protein